MLGYLGQLGLVLPNQIKLSNQLIRPYRPEHNLINLKISRPKKLNQYNPDDIYATSVQPKFNKK